MAFTKIRGPIGGERDAYNTRYLAQHTRLSALPELKFSSDHFRHPWEPAPEPDDTDNDDQDDDED